MNSCKWGVGYHVLDAPLHLLERGHALQEGDVGASRDGGAQPADCLVVAEPLQRVGPGDDDDVVVEPPARGRRRPDPRHEGVGVHELLAQQVAAALGRGLVLDVEAGHAGEDVPLGLFVLCD